MSAAAGKAPPLVSVCVPNLNKCRFLGERMESILAQTMTDWEAIVCDSYSNDGSWEFLQKFRDDPRVSLVQVPREGIYAGWNDCLKRAKGAYIYIATSDDSMSPECLERLVEPLERMPEVDIAMCEYDEIDEHSAVLPERISEQRRLFAPWAGAPCIRPRYWEFLFQAAAGITWQTITSVLFRRRLTEALGPFRRDLSFAADFDWSLKCSLVADIAYLPGRYATWRRYGEQATPENWKAITAITYHVLSEVLRTSGSQTPEAWRARTGWRAEILRKKQADYLEYSDLYLHTLRSRPRVFFDAVAQAARIDRSLLFNRAVQGFRWQQLEEMKWTSEQAFEHLRRFFAVETAPRPWASPPAGAAR